MAARESDLEPYRLEKAVASDCREHDHNCFAMDVGHNDFGQEVESLQRLNEVVDYHLDNSEGLKPIRKLYIIGAWRLTSPTEESEGECQRGEVSTPDKVLVIGTRLSTISTTNADPAQAYWRHQGRRGVAPGRQEDLQACQQDDQAGGVDVKWVWEGLSTSMTKIILDIGYPVRLMFDGYKSTQKGFISSSEMKPLVKQTKLKELRLFHMQDSYQSIIWETLYRNSTDEGMLLLDITMAVPPLVRSKDWRKASDVAGLAVAVVESGDQEYK
ncbi:hypothetical protein J1614_007767 [Plenodomus biglobosus]|nr:hypothetical protein J1614_007767 [Plenodomus biglobosus]